MSVIRLKEDLSAVQEFLDKAQAEISDSFFQLERIRLEMNDFGPENYAEGKLAGYKSGMEEGFRQGWAEGRIFGAPEYVGLGKHQVATPRFVGMA